MELLRKTRIIRTNSNIRKNGHSRGFGLFYCQLCNNIIELRLDTGKNAKTCGCIPKNYVHGDTKHNGKNSNIYDIWYRINKRCYYKKDNSYSVYGGRGVKVCDEWHSYKKFKEWALKNGYYSDKLTIDRIDNNGDYCPDNCHFTSHSQNSRFTRQTMINWPYAHIIRGLYLSGILTQKRIAEIFNVPRGVVHSVVNYRTWIDKEI